MLCILTAVQAHAQFKKKIDRGIFVDSLDNAFDLSSFIIDLHGFVPVPIIITEPALGGFGGGIVPVFLKKRPPMVDTLRSRIKITPTPPDMTGVAALYTWNKTWAAFAFRSGTWMKARSQYRLAGGYASVNLFFYRTLQTGEEKKFEFNMKTVPLFGYLLKRIRGTNWSAGVQYLYLHTEVKPVTGSIPEFVESKEIESTISKPGITVELDTRDNIFTPDKGIRFNTTVSASDEVFGSDYDYVNLNSYIMAFFPFGKKWVGGFRYEMQQVFGDPPFYLLPFINMRGVPTVRYQGDITSLVETEFRYDFVPRWSVVAFVGTGKAYDEWNAFDDADWITSGGSGFRYLVARRFKLRAGLDVARGPEQWTYYIIFGSAWFR